jgi:hypothetical protein
MAARWRGCCRASGRRCSVIELIQKGVFVVVACIGGGPGGLLILPDFAFFLLESAKCGGLCIYMYVVNISGVEIGGERFGAGG